MAEYFDDDEFESVRYAEEQRLRIQKEKQRRRIQKKKNIGTIQ